MHPATDLFAQLKVAAQAAYLDGATESQINTIVALARGSNSYNVLSGGRLTVAEAKKIIDSMIEDGAVADYEPTPDEVDDLFALQEERRRAKAAKVAQKRLKKEQEAQRADAARRIEGARVTHPKFGDGTVIDECEKVFTVMFDGQKKPLRMARAAVSEA